MTIFGVLQITMYYTAIFIHKFIITDDHAESCPFPLLGPALEVVNRTDQLQASRLFLDNFGHILTDTDNSLQA